MKRLSLLLVILVPIFCFSYQAFSEDTIHLAAYNGDEEKVLSWLATSPDPDARDSYGGTALHAAMFQKNLNIVRHLINAGYNVNAVGPSNGYTPLHDAVWADNLAALKLLIEHGGDLSIRGHDGNTPLEKARKEGKDEIVSYLNGLK